MLLTIVFAAVSVWGYISAEEKKKDNYDYILANAKSATEYYEAIVTDATRTEAYLGTKDTVGMIDLLISDGELTTEESAVINKLKGGLEQTDMWGYSTNVKVLDELKISNPSGYQDVCYHIGEAYLFYYNISVEKDKYSAAASWFQYSKNKYPISELYCDISECLQNITKFSKAEQYSNLYQEYQSLWEKVQALQVKVNDYDDDLKIRVWNEVVNMIRNNAEQFCEVSRKENIIALLDMLNADSSKITNSFLQQSVNSLQKNIETTQIKIQSVKIEQPVD